MKNLVVIMLLLAYSSILFAEGDPAIGKNKAIICVGCHGFDGNSSNDVYPKLAGQGESYLAKQLFDFKSGARKEEHMSSMVEAIEVSDILDIAAFFSSQKRTAEKIEKIKRTERAEYTLGKEIYHNGIQRKKITACASCHGPDGAGNPAAKFPSLRLQHAQYIEKSLNEFRDGTRSNDPMKMMRMVATRLSNKEIKALAIYVENLN